MYAALRPGLATLPGALLLAISSPYARRGELWHAYRKHHGVEADPVLCWQASTREMNPSVPEHVVAQALEADPERAAAEYLATFRSDVEAFLSREAVAACIEPGRRERAPIEGASYHAFCDPSGGSSDSMTLAVAHEEQGVAVLDCLRERRPPFSPEAVVAEFAEVLRRYRVAKVVSDRYASGFHAELWAKAGLQHVPSEKTKSALYGELLPAVNSGKVALLDHDRLVVQLGSLERRVGRGTGRHSIDAAHGGHDEVSNAAAGAVVAALQRPRTLWYTEDGVLQW